MPFREHSTDRQAVAAVRRRIDGQEVLRLEWTDLGVDASVLTAFRDRIMAGEMEEQLLTTRLDPCRERGLGKARGKQRTASTHGDRQPFARSTVWHVWEKRCVPR